MSNPEVVSRLQGQGIDVLLSTPAQMRQRSLDDLKRWGDIIRPMNLRLD